MQVVNRFQFLMVRLKVDERNYAGIPAYRISIPYGAIKSYYFHYVPFPEIYISIPYGAIKGEMMNFSNAIKRCISIPYGAIKKYL